jgi:hypothetical protein
VFDWALSGLAPQGIPLMIAGGLNPENVAAAIASTHPWGVDVATGVERSPGVKDPVKLQEFIERAKAADPLPSSFPSAPDDATQMIDLNQRTEAAPGGVYNWEDE